MNTIINIYIFTMCTRTKLYNLIKTLKNPRLERAPSSHQYVFWYYMDLSLPAISYPNCTTNSKIKYCFLAPKFLGFFPQSSIIRTPTVINIELCPCWKVQVSSIKIFKSFLTRIECSQSFLLENLTMILSLFLLSQRQASILFPEIFTPI